MRPGRNSLVDLSAQPGDWGEQTITDVLETFDLDLGARLARAIEREPAAGGLAARTASCAQRCGVTGTGDLWLLLLRRLGVAPAMTVLPERLYEQDWP